MNWLTFGWDSNPDPYSGSGSVCMIFTNLTPKFVHRFRWHFTCGLDIYDELTNYWSDSVSGCHLNGCKWHHQSIFAALISQTFWLCYWTVGGSVLYVYCSEEPNKDVFNSRDTLHHNLQTFVHQSFTGEHCRNGNTEGRVAICSNQLSAVLCQTKHLHSSLHLPLVLTH